MKPHKLQIGDKVIFNTHTKKLTYHYHISYNTSAHVCLVKDELKHQLNYRGGSEAREFYRIKDNEEIVATIIDISHQNPNIILIEFEYNEYTYRIGMLRRALLLYKPGSITKQINILNQLFSKLN